MITFALVPVRSRVLGAKLVASLLLAAAMLAIAVAVVAAGVLVSSPGVDGTWSDAAPLIGQSAVYLDGRDAHWRRVRRGPARLRARHRRRCSRCRSRGRAVASLSFFADVAPWLDTRLSLGPMPQEVMSATQWAHAGTSLAIWMLLPLLLGTWRITRREVAG